MLLVVFFGPVQVAAQEIDVGQVAAEGVGLAEAVADFLVDGEGSLVVFFCFLGVIAPDVDVAQVA